MTCRDCVYWDHLEDTQEGFCRRNAPEIVPDGGGWPTTFLEDWCGEFKNKHAAQQYLDMMAAMARLDRSS